MKNQLAYIDEFGNNGLDFDKEGVSTHFIVASIIIDEENLRKAEEIIENVRKSNFQTGEIKSSKIANNDTRRLKIISELNNVPYHIFAIVIDKRELEGEGFKYKGSFYKFLHSLVDRELFKVFPNLLIVADEIGTDEFKQGFIKYIRKNHIPNLFQQSDFRLSNSKSDLLVQLADLISGTLSKCFDEKKLSSQRTDFLTLLKDKIIEIRHWPPDYKPFTYEPLKDFVNYNPMISELGLNIANQFLEKYRLSSIPAEQDQCTCLKYLNFFFRNINPESYIPTYEIINQVQITRGSKINIHYFRSKIIAKLRDRGVLIASSNKGYKLPSCSKDLYEYVNHSNTYIQPMIERLLKCRNQIKLISKNDIDILDHEEFKFLKIIKDNMP